MLDLNRLARIEYGQKRSEVLPEVVIGFWSIGGVQPVIAPQQQHIATEPTLAVKRRFCFELLAGGQGTLKHGRQAVFDPVQSAPAYMRLTPSAIQQPGLPLCHVHSVVRIVGHQDHPWPVMDVPVVRHINE
jgi:hypothetical protein